MEVNRPIVLRNTNPLSLGVGGHDLLIKLDQLTNANMKSMDIGDLPGIAIHACRNPPGQIASPPQLCQRLLFPNCFIGVGKTGLAIEREFILKQEYACFQVNIQEVDFHRGEFLDVIRIRAVDMGTSSFPTDPQAFEQLAQTR